MSENKTFSAADVARQVLSGATTGSLATLSADGTPYASLATTARDDDGAPLLFLSRLAVHTRNLLRDPRASLLLVAPGGEGGDPLAGARVSLSGRAVPAGRSQARAARYLDAHPAAELYIDFADFDFYRFETVSTHLVAGFGRIVDLEPSDLGLAAAPTG